MPPLLSPRDFETASQSISLNSFELKYIFAIDQLAIELARPARYRSSLAIGALQFSSSRLPIDIVLAIALFEFEFEFALQLQRGVFVAIRALICDAFVSARDERRANNTSDHDQAKRGGDERARKEEEIRGKSRRKKNERSELMKKRRTIRAVKNPS